MIITIRSGTTSHGRIGHGKIIMIGMVLLHGVLMSGNGMIRKPLLKQNQWVKTHLVPPRAAKTGGANLGITKSKMTMTSHGIPRATNGGDIHQQNSGT